MNKYEKHLVSGKIDKWPNLRATREKRLRGAPLQEIPAVFGLAMSILFDSASWLTFSSRLRRLYLDFEWRSTQSYWQGRAKPSSRNKHA